MNWLIDGAYGSHYREAMGYHTLKEVPDEWAVERNLLTSRQGHFRRLAFGARRVADVIVCQLEAAVGILQCALTRKENVS
jgi:hypothetical protein